MQPNPNHLVSVPQNVGLLADQILEAGAQTTREGLALQKPHRHVRRKKLPAAVDMPDIDVTGGKIMMYWLGHDGRRYSATLAGLDYQGNHVVVTAVNENPGNELDESRRKQYCDFMYHDWLQFGC